MFHSFNKMASLSDNFHNIKNLLPHLQFISIIFNVIRVSFINHLFLRAL